MSSMLAKLFLIILISTVASSETFPSEEQQIENDETPASRFPPAEEGVMMKFLNDIKKLVAELGVVPDDRQTETKLTKFEMDNSNEKLNLALLITTAGLLSLVIIAVPILIIFTRKYKKMKEIASWVSKNGDWFNFGLKRASFVQPTFPDLLV